MPSAFKTTAACLQLSAGWSQAADADLIGLSSFVISQTDGAESLYTKQPRLLLLERGLYLGARSSMEKETRPSRGWIM